MRPAVVQERWARQCLDKFMGVTVSALPNDGETHVAPWIAGGNPCPFPLLSSEIAIKEHSRPRLFKDQGRPRPLRTSVEDRVASFLTTANATDGPRAGLILERPGATVLLALRSPSWPGHRNLHCITQAGRGL